MVQKALDMMSGVIRRRREPRLRHMWKPGYSELPCSKDVSGTVQIAKQIHSMCFRILYFNAT